MTGGFPAQRPVTRSFDDFFDLHLNKRLSKQSRRRQFETPSSSLWRHCNVKHRMKVTHEYLLKFFSVESINGEWTFVIYDSADVRLASWNGKVFRIIESLWEVHKDPLKKEEILVLSYIVTFRLKYTKIPTIYHTRSSFKRKMNIHIYIWNITSHIISYENSSSFVWLIFPVGFSCCNPLG